MAAIRRQDARAVISDGDLPGALAASRLQLPAIALGHGLVFSHTKRPQGLPRLPWFRQAAKARIASVGSTRQVAVNFAPLTPRRADTVVARPVLRSQLTDAVGEERPTGDEVLCYFRDDNGAPLLTALAAEGVPVRVFTPKNPSVPGVAWEPPDANRFTEALLTAPAVISSAGSQLISECVALGIPQLALYDPRDDEQRLNVGMLRAAGLGDGCTFDEATSPRIQVFLTGVAGEPDRTTPEPWAPDASAVVCRLVEELV